MKFSLVILVLLFFGCRTTPRAVTDTGCPLLKGFSRKVTTLPFPSFEEIKAYNGSFIAVEGYFAYNFEDIALYPKETTDNTAFALWLDTVGPDSLYDKLKGKWVQAVGRVNIAKKGHESGYMATLDSVFCVTEVAP